MPNHLANENSPYLLQHADNPVDWHPWGPEAFDKARSEDKPVFLSIGYSACHWCHVMAHESFEDPQTAEMMNQFFVNIKVDREERPDLDGIYMNAVVMLTGQGGWPMSVFLTPEGQPFYGGTYFPPTRRYNIPAFKEVLLAVARIWQQDRDRLLNTGSELTAHLQSENAMPGDFQAPDGTSLNRAAFVLVQTYDWENGGWGRAPKFPQAMAIEFLLRRARRGDKLALDICAHALKAMAKGGMYDVVGGGFARYSTDDEWRVPHFEKMLYDNALLAVDYLHAYLLTGEAPVRQVCEETLDFLMRELGVRGQDNHSLRGGLYSSLDADSEGEEGKFYLWTSEEIEQIVSIPEDIALFQAAYGVTEAGNFEGKTILQRALSDEQLGERFKISAAQIQGRLNGMNKKLLAARSSRLRPDTDDKVLVAWNGLALVAFAEAARYLDRGDYLDFARQTADFLLRELYTGERLLRSWRNGQAKHNAYLEDYAALILGLVALYQSDPNLRWYRTAVLLAEEMLNHFFIEGDGFYDTRDDQETLILRPRDIQDNATPSGSAMACRALYELAIFDGKMDWVDLVEGMYRKIARQVEKNPIFMAYWLCAFDMYIHPPSEVALLGNLDDSQMHRLVAALWSSPRSDCLAAISSFPPDPLAPSLLKDRLLLNGHPTAFVCRRFVCKLPVDSPEALIRQLSGTPE